MISNPTNNEILTENDLLDTKQELYGKYDFAYTDDGDDIDFEDFMEKLSVLCNDVLGVPPFHVKARGYNLNYRGAEGELEKSYQSPIIMIRDIAGQYQANLIGIKKEVTSNNQPYISMDVYHSDSRIADIPTHIEIFKSDSFMENKKKATKRDINIEQVDA